QGGAIVRLRLVQDALLARAFFAALALGRTLAGAAGLFRHGHADAGRKAAHGLGERRPGVLGQEPQRGSVRAAAEAMVELLGRADAERRRLFIVKRAQTQQVCAPFAQLDVPADDVDDIDARKQFLNEGIRNQSIESRRQLLAADALVVALDGGGALALALDRK